VSVPRSPLARSIYPPALLLGAVAAAAPLPAMAAGPGAQAGAAAPREGQDLNLLIAALTLDGRQLSDTIYLYESGSDVLVPVGELARHLTIGVTTDPLAHTAAGFVLSESAPFRIDPAAGTVTWPGGTDRLAPGEARWIDGDLYIPARRLAQWWPVDLAFDMAGLELKVHAREKLPVQLRLEREAAAAGAGTRAPVSDGAAWPKLRAPYRLVSVPAVDMTLGAGIDRTPQGTTTRLAYAAVIAGDMAGMEGTAFVTIDKQEQVPRARITLSRHDPDGGLLGPLRATSVELGNVGLPALRNVLSGGGTGWGAALSNRPLDLPSSYGLQTLRGELPQGWDVTLYFNEALIGFARSRPDGLYEFPDQPLVFGRNEFRLVFNGPLGQHRVETRVYLLDQSVTAPGALYYSAGMRADAGALRGTVQVDAGVLKGLALTAGAVHLEGAPDGGSFSVQRLARPHTYLNGGLRASLGRALVNLDHVHDLSGGSLTELGLRTALAGVSVDASRTWVRGFESDLFAALPDPARLRDRVRLAGLLAFSPRLRMPFAVDLEHERAASGRESWLVQPRLSITAWSTALTNAMRWEWGSANGGHTYVSGALQASRRVAGVGLSGQLAYSLVPEARVDSVAIALDKAIGPHNRATLGVTRLMREQETTFTAGWTRNFGSFGLGFSALYTSPRRFGFGLQLFTAFGRDPLQGRLLRDWQPLAQTGAVAARVFVDGNGNGRFDPGEQPVEGAGFTINGNGRQQVRTDAAGTALIPRLPPRGWTSLGVDPGTLEDASWQPERPGINILPRPGKVQAIDFPVTAIAEIDGTVWLAEAAGRRPIGNARLQLVTPDGRVAAEAVSASDGYYIVPGVVPGSYTLRIDPAQLADLGLSGDRVDVMVRAGAPFVNGIELTVKAAAARR